MITDFDKYLPLLERVAALIKMELKVMKVAIYLHCPGKSFDKLTLSRCKLNCQFTFIFVGSRDSHVQKELKGLSTSADDPVIIAVSGAADSSLMQLWEKR